MTERNRFPGYSTLAKRDTPSWNAQTRAVVDKRLNDAPPRRFFTEDEWRVLVAICARIIPTGRLADSSTVLSAVAEKDVDGRAKPGHDDGGAKPGHDDGGAKPGHDDGGPGLAEGSLDRAVDIIAEPTQRDRRVPIAAFIDQKMADNNGDGFQQSGLPDMQQEWRRGLSAIDAEARLRFGTGFADLPAGRQDDVLYMVQHGDVRAPAWADLPAKQFFKGRLLIDIVTMYYAHPQAWDEIGFGGPASPRGYVRMGFDRYDPWEAVEHA